MRKTIAILLLAIFLVNTYGYHFLLSVAENRSEVSLQNDLDKDRYETNQLFLVTVPAEHLSAYTNQHSFDHVNGKIEIAGMIYRYVKMRLQNDSLQLLCVRDTKAMGWQSAKAQFFAVVNDLDHRTHNKQPSVSKLSVPSDFIADPMDFMITHQLGGSAARINSDYASQLVGQSYPLIDNPPELFI